MNYDNYKLSNPVDDGYNNGLVTSCCGVEEEVSETSNCCDSKFWAETDICGECKEHADTYMVCTECGDDEDCYTMIEEYEYEQNMRDHYDEMKSDGDRDER
jgi:predicted amidophosphoribosyltransferase